MKPLSELTLMDRFLFARAMEDLRILQLVLQIILCKEIVLRNPSETEKEFRTVPWLRSIRLDVFTMDRDASLYSTEVQKKNTGNLIKRSRFYQALIDSSLLPPGEIDFNQMPPACLIMIAPFDLFGQGKYCYSFRMKCEEAEDLWMEDGVTRIFLNTHGHNDEEVNPELVELLHYFETTSGETASECKSERIKEIHKRICRIKASEEIGVRYMQEWEEKIYELREAKEQGLEQGVEQGLEQGLERGIKQGMKALILDNLEEGVPKARIISKLQKRFDLDGKKAEEYYERFSSEAQTEF